MNQHLSTAHITQNALKNLSKLPHEKAEQVGVGKILWCDVANRRHPLTVELQNGSIFKCGGLSDNQFRQLPALMPDLLGIRLVFFYTESSNGHPDNAKFKTLLINNDARPAAICLVSVLDQVQGAVQ